MSAAHTPDRGRGQALVGPGDLGIPQQVRIDFGPRRRPAGATLPVDGTQTHHSHELLHPLTTYRHALPFQRGLHPPGTVARGIQVLAVQLPHQGKVLLRGPLGTVVEAGAADAQQLALPHYRQVPMSPVHQFTPLCRGHGPDLSSKKSRSTFSCPIC